MKRMATGAYIQRSLSTQDESDLLAFIAELDSSEYRWHSEIDRKNHMARVQQKLRRNKTLDRLHPNPANEEIEGPNAY